MTGTYLTGAEIWAEQNIRCRECRARAGEKCRSLAPGGRHGRPLKHPHEQRRNDGTALRKASGE